MPQIVNIPANPNYLSDKTRQVWVDDLFIPKNRLEARVLFRVVYLNNDETLIKVPGLDWVQKEATADNTVRVHPLTGVIIPDGQDQTGSVGEFDFLYEMQPAFVQTMYPSAITMGQLIDAQLDLMIKRMAAMGRFD